MNNVNWTQNQKLVAAGILSILVSAASTTATGIVQTYTTSGLDIPVLVNVAVVTFFPLLAAALLNYIPAHAMQLLAASEDSKAQLAQSLQGLQQQHSALIAATVQAKSQPVQPAPLVPSPPVPAAVPQPVQQQPFLPPQVTMPGVYSPAVYTAPASVDRHFGDTTGMPVVQ